MFQQVSATLKVGLNTRRKASDGIRRPSVRPSGKKEAKSRKKVKRAPPPLENSTKAAAGDMQEFLRKSAWMGH